MACYRLPNDAARRQVPRRRPRARIDPVQGSWVSLFFRHAWLLFIAVTILNGAVAWRRVQPRMAAHPELRAGYRRLMRGWLVYGNVPWVVMGLGILFGGLRGIADYFHPRNGPF